MTQNYTVSVQDKIAYSFSEVKKLTHDFPWKKLAKNFRKKKYYEKINAQFPRNIKFANFFTTNFNTLTPEQKPNYIQYPPTPKQSLSPKNFYYLLLLKHLSTQNNPLIDCIRISLFRSSINVPFSTSLSRNKRIRRYRTFTGRTQNVKEFGAPGHSG